MFFRDFQKVLRNVGALEVFLRFFIFQKNHENDIFYEVNGGIVRVKLKRPSTKEQLKCNKQQKIFELAKEENFRVFHVFFLSALLQHLKVHFYVFYRRK